MKISYETINERLGFNYKEFVTTYFEEREITEYDGPGPEDLLTEEEADFMIEEYERGIKFLD